MKKTGQSFITLFLVGLILSIPSCMIVDDDEVNVVCTADCTTITGRFTTEDNKPLAGMAMELDWRVDYGQTIGLGGERRKIMTGETDQNGNYSFSFYAKDRDLLEGYFSIRFHAAEEEYFVHENHSYFGVYDVKRRDTTVTITNYHLPRRGATLILRLTNPQAITGDDQVNADVAFGCMHENAKCGWGGGLSSRQGSEATVSTAANQYAYVGIHKRISGEYIHSLDSIFVPANETKIYEFAF